MISLANVVLYIHIGSGGLLLQGLFEKRFDSGFFADFYSVSFKILEFEEMYVPSGLNIAGKDATRPEVLMRPVQLVRVNDRDSRYLLHVFGLRF